MRDNSLLKIESIAEHLCRFAPDPATAASTRIIIEDSLSSTNTTLSEMSKDSKTAFPTALFARRQTGGMGRLGRKWHGGNGVLCVSVAVRFVGDTAGLESFTPLCGLEICSALTGAFGGGFMIKWPNDIYFGSRKLSGMLANLMVRSPSQGGGCVAVMGVGLNCSRDSVPGEISGTSVDLREALGGESPDMNLVGALVVGSVERAARRIECGETKDLRERFSKYDFLYGRQVEALAGGVVFTGRAGGVNGVGELVLNTADGREVSISAGEATLLKK